jgi:hypothetical protein
MSIIAYILGRLGAPAVPKDKNCRPVSIYRPPCPPAGKA